jgi:hypothetical protein
MTTRLYQSNDGKVLTILNEHINTKGGNFKGVCVSACLSYLGIQPHEYKYTSSRKTIGLATINAIMRRFGWAVRSRKSTLLKGTKTVGSVRREIASYEDYSPDTVYLVHVSGHVLLLNAKGETIVDTAPRKVDRRTVYDVKAIFKG